MSYKNSRYGWLPDLPDPRGDYYGAPAEWRGCLMQHNTRLTDKNLASHLWTIRIVQQ